jgi:hypothetical protein
MAIRLRSRQEICAPRRRLLSDLSPIIEQAGFDAFCSGLWVLRTAMYDYEALGESARRVVRTGADVATGEEANSMLKRCAHFLRHFERPPAQVLN